MKWPAVVQVKLPPNPYNRGFWENLGEVLWWEAHLQRAATASAAVMKAESGAGNPEGLQPGDRDGVDAVQGRALRQQPCRPCDDAEAAAAPVVAVGRQGQVISRRQKQR